MGEAKRKEEKKSLEMITGKVSPTLKDMVGKGV
jgi:hypothetical protein